MIGPFTVQDGDRVSIAPILPYSDKTVYLQGHVYRPGNYAFKEGMKITDLIHSYQEVLPEPSNHAEIIRMQPPDFRPQTIEVDLASALGGRRKSFHCSNSIRCGSLGAMKWMPPRSPSTARFCGPGSIP